MGSATDRTAARDHLSGSFNWRTFAPLLLVNLVIISAGVATTFLWPRIGVAGYAVALMAVGIFTFLMLFVDNGDIRSALTASFVFVYLALLATGSLNKTVADKMSEGFGKTIFDNFNTLVGVIIGFYFGGKALEKFGAATRGNRV